MILEKQARRSCVAVAAGVAAILATLTLVPALAQGAATPGTPPYIELMSNLTSENQYIRYVDGDAATTDPQQSFTSLSPWTLSTPPELVTVAASADPQVMLAGTSCLGAGGEPIGALPPVSPTHYTQPPLGWLGALPLIGVTSYTCAEGPPPAIVPESATALITPGEALAFASGADLPLDFRSLKLSVNTTNSSELRVTAKLAGSVVGTIDIDVDVDCVDSTDWENADVLCATRVVPVFGALQQRYLNLDFGGPFDSFEITATVGSVRLKGKHASRFFLDGEVFGSAIGGDTGATSTAEPATETLPGYEIACADAADPPPEGPCGGKEVALNISRYLADLDHDGASEQVLDVQPSGSVQDLALLTLTIDWAAEDAPVGAIPLSAFDEDGDGPDDDDPAAWCSVDPPGAPGDQWCVATSSSTAAGTGQIQVTETYQGTGDPRASR